MIPQPQQEYYKALQSQQALTQQTGLLNDSLNALGPNGAFGWVWPTTSSTSSTWSYANGVVGPEWFQTAMTPTKADAVPPTRTMPDDERWLRNRVAEIVKAGAL